MRTDVISDVVMQVEELVEPGQLNPNEIHTPACYVHRILKGDNYEKRIEVRLPMALVAVLSCVALDLGQG